MRAASTCSRRLPPQSPTRSASAFRVERVRVRVRKPRASSRRPEGRLDGRYRRAAVMRSVYSVERTPRGTNLDVDVPAPAVVLRYAATPRLARPRASAIAGSPRAQAAARRREPVNRARKRLPAGAQTRYRSIGSSLRSTRAVTDPVVCAGRRQRRRARSRTGRAPRSRFGSSFGSCGSRVGVSRGQCIRDAQQARSRMRVEARRADVVGRAAHQLEQLRVVEVRAYRPDPSGRAGDERRREARARRARM